MEATPDATAPEGVQVRTEDGRVATVLSRKTRGYYAIKVDGEDKNVQQTFFASDGQDLPRLLASVPDASKKKGPAHDTPLRLRDKDGEIVGRTTMRAWSKESGLDVPEGYEDHHEIVVNVPKSWTTARWSTSTGARKINSATVDGHKVELDGPASTSRGDDGRHVLDIAKLKFRPRGEVRDWSYQATIGTDAREASPWRDGAVHTTGDDLRSLLTAEVFDEEETVRAVSYTHLTLPTICSV